MASTKAFSNMVAALTIFALQIGRARQLSANEARVLAKGLQEVPDLIERYLANPGPIDEAVAMIMRPRHCCSWDVDCRPTWRRRVR